MHVSLLPRKLRPRRAPRSPPGWSRARTNHGLHYILFLLKAMGFLHLSSRKSDYTDAFMWSVLVTSVFLCGSGVHTAKLNLSHCGPVALLLTCFSQEALVTDANSFFGLSECPSPHLHTHKAGKSVNAIVMHLAMNITGVHYCNDPDVGRSTIGSLPEAIFSQVPSL